MRQVYLRHAYFLLVPDSLELEPVKHLMEADVVVDDAVVVVVIGQPTVQLSFFHVLRRNTSTRLPTPHPDVLPTTIEILATRLLQKRAALIVRQIIGPCT